MEVQPDKTFTFKLGVILTLTISVIATLVIGSMLLSLAVDIGYWIRGLIF